MITSPITHITYDQNNSNCVYISNMLQAKRYLEYLGPEYLYDILWNSDVKRRKDCIVFVFKRCPETAKAKILWDNHEL